jgi:hypothetical protein
VIVPPFAMLATIVMLTGLAGCNLDTSVVPRLPRVSRTT